MGTLYLVRHGQASFGADDYDQLSELGTKQSERLGAYFAGKGVQFDAAYTGTLKRQIQTLAGIFKGGSYDLPSEQRAGLNEYNSEAVIGAIHPHKLTKPQSKEEYRNHFRLLRDGLTQWMAGVVTPHGMPEYTVWQQGIVDTMDLVRNSSHSNVLIVSSGGPISTVVGHILGTSPETTIDLNMRIRNSSVTEFAFTPKRHMLVTYNTLPHLEDKSLESWITYT